MTASRRLLAVPLVLAALVAAPAAQATTFERIRLDAVPYAFEEVQCGIEVQVEGTVSGLIHLRAGKGDKATAFFEHDVIAYRETWTAANGRFVTVTGKSSFNDVKAVPLGDDTPGGIVVEQLEPSVRGPHPGFDDATLCPVLVLLLEGA